jgi:hypothetical protein
MPPDTTFALLLLQKQLACLSVSSGSMLKSLDFQFKMLVCNRTILLFYGAAIF